MNKYPYIGEWKDIGVTILFTSESKGFNLNGQQLAYNDWNEKEYENITPDYLEYKCGKVDSVEHAEFIKIMSANNDIKCSHRKIDDSISYFYFMDNCLFFSSECVPVTNVFKGITIPLPPKTENEWPQVGDEVMFTPNPSINGKLNATVKYIGNKYTVLESDSGREFSRRNSKLLIEKPKTEQQLLREELWDFIGESVNKDSLIDDIVTELITNYNITKNP